MIFYLAVLLAPAAAVADEPQDRRVYVARASFDCYVARPQRPEASRGGNQRTRSGAPRDLYYLDLTRCPPRVRPAERRLNSFPNLTRWPRVNRSRGQGVTRGGQRVDTVILVSREELECLASQRQLRRVRSIADRERYAIALDRCR